VFRLTRGDDDYRCGFVFLPAGLRVHWAPGIPHALSGRKITAKLGRIAPRERETVSAAAIPGMTDGVGRDGGLVRQTATPSPTQGIETPSSPGPGNALGFPPIG
jgi:hypothetical protein